MGAYHPECPERLAAIGDHMIAQGLDHFFAFHEAPRATFAQLMRVHTVAHLEYLKSLSPEHGIVHIDPDTAMNPYTWQAALRAAGAGVKAVDLIMAGEARNAFCCVRPPGHHAEPQLAMGFSFLNNIAVAAMHALKEYGLRRIAIVDFDVHHGNGTQESFYSDSRVLYFSTHQYPFYPGTGALSETGAGQGAGYTLNCPMRGGKRDGHYLAVFRYILQPVIESFEPDLILVSAGFDAHAMDPIGGMQLSSNGFAAIAAVIQEAARDAGAPVVYSLEGGYNLAALKDSASRVIHVLKGEPAPDIEPLAFPELENFIRIHGSMWPLTLR